ncbi:MAG: Hsp33 family molecular chaperone HslO [Peptoniphilaceae bacterium]|nr:Hsp33 family molecular chaperone HslO [Peptoniphilaceae bacterium]
MDKVIRAVDRNQHFRFTIVDTTAMVEEMRRIHAASTTASAAMGRLLTMMVILSYHLGNEQESITVNIRGGGPGGYLVGLTDQPGKARVTAQNPTVDIPSRPDHHLDVGSWVGKDGTLSLVRGMHLKDPVVGITELVSGELGEDFASYFFHSEQTPAIVAVGVLVEPDYHVSHAGGIFVQAMPGATDEELDRLQSIADQMPSVTDLLRQGKTPEEILQDLFGSMNPAIMETGEPSYACSCSREKMHQALLSLPFSDRRVLAEEDHGAEVICEFCRTRYHFTEQELYLPGENL